MKSILFILFASCISLVSCDKEYPNDNGLARVVFDPGNLKFISTSMNPKKGTMSALYGNQAALESLSKEEMKPEPGSVMKLVTWRYHDNPQYFGGTINGELLSVETVLTDQQGNISYDVKNNQGNKAVQAQTERIQYFMSYRPVKRP
ncbi:hypothetical protein EGY07_06845 [Chryseobacterium indologenes]|uniref:hypothetical protein n=1 Tax=Chryseobacterium indologenes TaxID=253 RepID=UPI000F4E3E28|nr:hypothetical protein [Chryseobacterium indologenes]AYZ35307.1 hypothetical protein EGY07_06845 [Chryseobacterium indologenes]MBF6644046.1 hypothetical protein [Chryseobacterium indologenes]MBU3049898.1 cytochrome P460 family protein [Chryseobacterium indologenes]MEB4761358.1 hypothetical protein [Chryseobacterium indologenes]QQQ72231.1 hypothetical protein JHW31_05770 [Chryseobacterium indologenes]